MPTSRLRLPIALCIAAGVCGLPAPAGPPAKQPTASTPLVEATPAPSASSAPSKSKATPVARPRYQVRRVHDPDGTGKFFLGREIAQVMGHQGISWLERPEREEEERLSLLIEALRLEPGMVVADIGAGSGVISRMIAAKVGDEGTVLAVDIQQEMLDALSANCAKSGVKNVQPVLGQRDSPGLNPETVDLVVMVDVYHEFDLPYEMLLEISRAMKPGGRIAFVEYRKEDRDVPIKEVHKMTQAQVKKEAGLPEFGLRWTGTDNRLPRQHVIFFEKIGEMPVGSDQSAGTR